MRDGPVDRYDFEPSPELNFGDQGGRTLPVRVHRLDVSEDIVLVGALAPPYIESLVESGMFHVGDELDGVAWFDDDDVLLTLRLDREIRAAFEDSDAFVSALFAGDSAATESLKSGQAWFLLEALQTLRPPPGMEDAEISAGARTRWARV